MVSDMSKHDVDKCEEYFMHSNTFYGYHWIIEQKSKEENRARRNVYAMIAGLN